MLDFGALPPEINSTRMYAGAGSGPLLSAATAWSTLAAELESSAAETRALVGGLDAAWQGPSAEQMNAKMAQHISWLTNTAAAAQHTAGKANAAAAAYQAAYAATVNPAEVSLNRSTFATLVATNLLGQNTPAIMANEAEYSEMWAQDATAMYAYAAQSSAATNLQTFSQPTTGTGTPAATTSSLSGIVSQILSQISFDPFNDTWALGMMTAGWIAAFIQGVPAMLAVANNGAGSGFNPATAVPKVGGQAPTIDIAPVEIPSPIMPKLPHGRMSFGERVGGMSVPPAWGSAASAAETPAAAPFVPFGGGEEAAPLGVMPMGIPGTSGTSEERRQQPKYGKKVQVLPTVGSRV